MRMQARLSSMVTPALRRLAICREKIARSFAESLSRFRLRLPSPSTAAGFLSTCAERSVSWRDSASVVSASREGASAHSSSTWPWPVAAR